MAWLFAIAISGIFSPSLAQSPIASEAGLSQVRWNEAEKVVGSTAIVSGKVVAVGKAGRVNFLNFDKSRRDVFKVVIFAEDLHRFPMPLHELYHQKLVTVRGGVTLYKSVPQIQVTSVDQIKVVDQLPPTRLRKPVQRQVGERIKVAR